MNMSRLVVLATISASLLAQQRPSFEVASVKLRPPSIPISMIGGSPSGSRLTLEAMSVSDLVSWAYNMKPWQVAKGPEWTGANLQKDRTVLDEAKRFDIVAKAEGDAPRSPEEFRQMLQSLLADRFHLALHRETREMPVYALVPDKNGPKFHESAPDTKGILRMNGRGKIVATGGTMTQLAGWFSNANGVDRPVLDETCLRGQYDFTLEWANPRMTDASDSTVSWIFTAMREQLGLKLEPRRAPVEVLVIDHADLPGEN
jgi:uncharacterized protein (TIGR03435 family)